MRYLIRVLIQGIKISLKKKEIILRSEKIVSFAQQNQALSYD